jgi:hypothetical protein
MRNDLALALVLLALLPTPAFAGGAGPAVGSVWGIIIIVVALLIGFFIGRTVKK